MWFGKSRQQKQKQIDRDAKIAESQNALLTAAVQTTTIAQEVTRTMQKRMDDAIRQFVQTARIMNDALLICDPSGSITAFNPAAQRMFGLPDNPVEPVSELFTKANAPVSAEELWKLGRSKKRTVQGIHSDGSRFPAHIRVALLDRSDGTTVALMVVQDLTLIHSNFNNSIHGYAVVANNEIIAVNGSVSRIFGYAQDDLLGCPADILTSSKDRSGQHLDLVFEVARILWEGEEALLITARESRTPCPTCGRSGYHSH